MAQTRARREDSVIANCVHTWRMHEVGEAREQLLRGHHEHGCPFGVASPVGVQDPTAARFFQAALGKRGPQDVSAEPLEPGPVLWWDRHTGMQ